jgi:glycosyltransferase involved in cell wall biosynthesis
MRILQFITGLRMGGAEKQLLLLTNALKQNGHTVKVVAMEAGGVIAGELKLYDIEVEELGVSSLADIPAAYLKLSAVIKQFKPDVIHSHMIHANLMSRYFKLFNKQYKLINTAHNIKEGNTLTMMGYKLTKAIPDWCTNVSQEAYNHFIEAGYFNNNTSCFVPNAVDTDIFNPKQEIVTNLRKDFNLPKNAYIFLSAGRLHPQKNHEMLIRAFQKVACKLNNVYLIIAGEGPLLPLLKACSADLGIVDRVIFAGRRNDMPQLLANCNCFVLSSNHEGFGLVVAEAMALLKPVIATDCGGVKEVMGGYGQLIKPADTDSLARAMQEMYCSPPEAEQLPKARAHIEQHYSLNQVLNQWLTIYAN